DLLRFNGTPRIAEQFVFARLADRRQLQSPSTVNRSRTCTPVILLSSTKPYLGVTRLKVYCFVRWCNVWCKQNCAI
ncbi:hypothetical protein GBAR_LOCUS25107, partial [Geodia barretti]